MTFAALTSRHALLEILFALCARRAQARLRGVAGDLIPATAHTRFSGLRADRIALEWPARLDWPVDTPFDVQFVHRGIALTFLTRVVDFATRASGRIAWLPIPVRFVPNEARCNQRYRLDSCGPVSATFTNIENETRRFAVTLENISAGGLGAIVRPEEANSVRLEGLYRVRFELPLDPRPLAFIARVVHTHALAEGGARLGAVFCALDEPTLNASQLEQIERFARSQIGVRRNRACSHGEGGIRPC